MSDDAFVIEKTSIESPYYPWYAVLWRAFWILLFYYVGLSLAFLGILMVFGYGTARAFWDDQPIK